MHCRALFSTVTLAGLWLNGCGADPKSGPASASPNPASTSSSTAAPTGATSPLVPAAETEQIVIPVDDDTDGVDVPPARECQRDVYEAKPVELNLLLLVDLSGSMLTKVDEETLDTQWEAVRVAIREFVSSTDADGLGISITYYPVLEERTACMENAVCDDGLACVSAVCAIPTLYDYPIPCQSQADCPWQLELEDGSLVADECVLPYSCTNYPLQFCLIDDNCPNGDTCDVDAGPIGACPGANSCAVEDYANAAVPLQVLPDGRAELLASLDESYVDFYSTTPTHVALKGAFEQVRTWREQEPQKRSVVVLATDGIPEGCETFLQPDAAQTTLEVLQAGTDEGVSTFVIGVLPEDPGSSPELTELLALQTEFLGSMASAGATQAPVLVRADVNTTQAFLEALDQVRAVALPCDYELPEGTTDFDHVNVELTAAGETSTLPKVDSRAACDGAGWYYDSDETAADDAPSRVVLCPTACESAKQVDAERVDVVLGCPTIRQIQ